VVGGVRRLLGGEQLSLPSPPPPQCPGVQAYMLLLPGCTTTPAVGDTTPPYRTPDVPTLTRENVRPTHGGA
jgi:hypothetical protein